MLLSAKYSTALGPNFTASFIPGQEASGPAILEGFQTAEKRNILPKLPLGMLNIYFVRCIFLAQTISLHFNYKKWLQIVTISYAGLLFAKEKITYIKIFKSKSIQDSWLRVYRLLIVHIAVSKALRLTDSVHSTAHTYTIRPVSSRLCVLLDGISRWSPYLNSRAITEHYQCKLKKRCLVSNYTAT